MILPTPLNSIAGSFYYENGREMMRRQKRKRERARERERERENERERDPKLEKKKKMNRASLKVRT